MKRGDEHLADSFAVTPLFYESCGFNHGAHRANEHHGQRLLNREHENRLGKSLSADRLNNTTRHGVPLTCQRLEYLYD